MRAWQESQLLPPRLRDLVPPDVDVRAGEEVADLVEHILEELDRGVPGAEDVLVHPPRFSHLERPAGAGQLRVRGERGQRMAGELDLRNDHHVPQRGVVDHLPDLRLRVEPAVPGRIELHVAVRPDHRAVSPRADLRQLRIFPDFDAPALVVGQVPVEDVHLVERQEIDVFLDELHGEEMPRDVEVHSPPGEPRGVHHRNAGDDPVDLLFVLRGAAGAEHLGREQLEERQRAVRQPGGRIGADQDVVLVDHEPVSLGTEFRLVEDHDADVIVARAFVVEHQHALPGAHLDFRERKSRRPPEPLREEHRAGRGPRIVVVECEDGRFVQLEFPLPHLEDRRPRDDVTRPRRRVVPGVCRPAMEPPPRTRGPGREERERGGKESVHGVPENFHARYASWVEVFFDIDLNPARAPSYRPGFPPERYCRTPGMSASCVRSGTRSDALMA